MFSSQWDGNDYVSGTWEWDGVAWSERLVPGPGGREEHAMVYDSSRHVTVLFGGITRLGFNKETWEWNGISWINTYINQYGLLPRASHAMAYDSRRGVTVLFGGNDSWNHPNDETWLYGAPCISPTFTTQPAGGTLYAGQQIVLAAEVASTGSVVYQWRKDGLDVSDSEAYSGASTATLTIRASDQSQSGAYTLRITNTCGAATSRTATVEVRCIADYNADGGIDGSDVEAFFTDWQVANPAADLNNDGGIDDSDVEVFFTHWEAGC